MLNALIFIVLLLVAVVLVAVVLVWQPPERMTPEKARLIRGAAGVGAILIFFAAGSLMLGGMVTVKGESGESGEAGNQVEEAGFEERGSGEAGSQAGEADSEERGSGEEESDQGSADVPVGKEKSAAEQLEDVKVGSLKKETIQKSVETMKPYVKACYEDTLKEFPDAAGKVVIGFTIIGEGGEGRVEMSELEAEKTTLFDSKLHDCMLEAVGDLEFEVPEGGGKVKVRYPFNFETDE